MFSFGIGQSRASRIDYEIYAGFRTINYIHEIYLEDIENSIFIFPDRWLEQAVNYV
jgi:hypothetical protein